MTVHTKKVLSLEMANELLNRPFDGFTTLKAFDTYLDEIKFALNALATCVDAYLDTLHLLNDKNRLVSQLGERLNAVSWERHLLYQKEVLLPGETELFDDERAVKSVSWALIKEFLEMIAKPWKTINPDGIYDVLPFEGGPKALCAVKIIIDKGWDRGLGYEIEFNSDYTKIRRLPLTGFGKMIEGKWAELKL